MDDRSTPPPAVPAWLSAAAGIAWRVVAVAAAIVVLGYAVAKLRVVVLPVIVAALLCTLLWPPVRYLRAHRWPPALAALAAMVPSLALLAGVAAVVAPAFVRELDVLGDRLEQGVQEVARWMLEGPLDLSQSQLDDLVQGGLDELRDSSGAIASGVLSGALVALEITFGAVLAVVLLFFFLKDGDRMWAWALARVGPARREDVRAAGERAWQTLASYIRGITAVALFDALGIGLALALLGVPLVVPLMVITFFGAYIPFAGAILAGLAAVLVALVAEGLTTAILVAVAVIVVQQVESNLLHPVVVGRAVALHPVVILLLVTSGAVVAGILGAMFVVPLAAAALAAAARLRCPPAPGPAPDPG